MLAFVSPTWYGHRRKEDSMLGSVQNFGAASQTHQSSDVKKPRQEDKMTCLPVTIRAVETAAAQTSGGRACANAGWGVHSRHTRGLNCDTCGPCGGNLYTAASATRIAQASSAAQTSGTSARLTAASHQPRGRHQSQSAATAPPPSTVLRAATGAGNKPKDGSSGTHIAHGAS